RGDWRIAVERDEHLRRRVTIDEQPLSLAVLPEGPVASPDREEQLQAAKDRRPVSVGPERRPVQRHIEETLPADPVGNREGLHRSGGPELIVEIDAPCDPRRLNPRHLPTGAAGDDPDALHPEDRRRTRPPAERRLDGNRCRRVGRVLAGPRENPAGRYRRADVDHPRACDNAGAAVLDDNVGVDHVSPGRPGPDYSTDQPTRR